MHGHTDGRTHKTTAALLYPHRNALRGDNNCEKYYQDPIKHEFMAHIHFNMQTDEQGDSYVNSLWNVL